ncbi:HpcH/HpaI aldolase/citrate lyase family protein [Brucella gallinifaecis]|uniref:Aldolase n=1 Tax=Brucella gallinifaecis TaxID=215590 RepID=A0A502BN37_9HYPH|nr:aldolase/citrate lyase family protein [Brucella gallinifaecis]TPF74678.1 aldolase [Brucella gallinifaecis]
MNLRERIKAGELLVGPFQKTPSPQITELLGLGGVDFIVADQEHAPIGIDTLDLIALAGRAVGLPVMIRATLASPAAIWPALDLGCLGVMVPHIRNASDANAVADAMKYARGRGFSPSGRAGEYGRMPAADYRATSDSLTVFLAQIEDACALDKLDEIAAIAEVDVLFIGPQDLSLSLGCTIDAPEMQKAIDQVISAAKRHGKASGFFVPDASHIPALHSRGMTVFVCGSDQGLLRNGASQLMSAVHNIKE